MGAGKGVVDIQLAQPGEFAGQCRVIRLFAAIEADILAQQRLAGPKVERQALCRIAGGNIRKDHFAAKRAGQGGAQLVHRKLGVHLAPGAAQMGQDDQPRALLQQGAHPGGKAVDPAAIGDLAIADRHVEIGADKQALAGKIGLGDRADGHHSGPFIARVVAAPQLMRPDSVAARRTGPRIRPKPFVATFTVMSDPQVVRACAASATARGVIPNWS